MKLVFVNYFIDLCLLISALICSITGLLKWKELQVLVGLSGSGRGFGNGGNITSFVQNGGMHGQNELMGIITPIHEWAGVITVILALIHMILHRHWLAEMTRRTLARKKE